MSLRSTPTPPPQPGALRSPLVSTSRNETSGEDEKCGDCVEDEKKRGPGQRPHRKKEDALDALEKEISKKSTIQSQDRPPDDISTMDENTIEDESVEDTVPSLREDTRGYKIGTTSRSRKGNQKTRAKKRELYTMSLQFTEEELGKAISTTPLWKKLKEELSTKATEIQRLKKLVGSQRKMIGSLRTRLSSYKSPRNSVREAMLIKMGRNSIGSHQRSPLSMTKSPTTSRNTTRNPTISSLKRGKRTPRTKLRMSSLTKRPKTVRKPKRRPSTSPRNRTQSARSSKRKSHDIPGRTEKTSPYRSKAGRKKNEQTSPVAKNAATLQQNAEDILAKGLLEDEFYQSSPDYAASRELNRRSKSAPKKRHHGQRGKSNRHRISHPRKSSRAKNVHLNTNYAIKKKASSKSRSSTKYTGHSTPIRIDERKLPVSGEPVIVRIDLMRGHESE